MTRSALAQNRVLRPCFTFSATRGCVVGHISGADSAVSIANLWLN